MNESITINGHIVEVHEVDDVTGRVRFKLDNTWRDPMDFIVPNCTALEFVMRVHKAGTTGDGGFWSREVNTVASNSEVRRWLDNASIRFNGKPLKPKDMLDFPLHSVVMFPKGNRITIL
jgi:hypothetical protein